MQTIRAGRLQLTHDSEWQQSVALEPGETMLWCLPAGEYQAIFFPGAPGAEATAGRSATQPGTRFTLAEGAIVSVTFAGDPPRLSAAEAGAEALGTQLQLARKALEALPGDAGVILGALDTRVRWRPGATLDGQPMAVPAERRQLLINGDAAAAARLSLSPHQLDGEPWSLTTGAGDVRPRERSFTFSGGDSPALHVTAGYQTSLHDEEIATGHARLDPRPLLGLNARGHLWIRHCRQPDASPRARAERILPGNDARRLDLIARLTFGSPAAALLAENGRVLSSLSMGEPEQDRQRWGLALGLTARGWRRNHFLESYRRNLDHMPHEETTWLQGEATATLRLSHRRSLQLSLGLDTYESSYSDGVHRETLAHYLQPGGNPGAGEDGLYWQGNDGSEFGDAHVYDYYQWKHTREWRMRLRFSEVRGASTRLAAIASGRFLTYRRFDHYAPTLLTSGGTNLSRALLIGHDPTTGKPGDDPFPPGTPFAGDLAVTLDRTISDGGHLHLAAGGLLFSARDSVLADARHPLGENVLLDGADFSAPQWHLRPQVHLTYARRPSPRLTYWASVHQRALLPPLEALYSPRAYLVQNVDPEGVMGNPALEPELERAAEIGLAVPWPAGILTGRLALAGYAARLDDAITMSAAHLGEFRGLLQDGDWVPIYENGGTLRQWGLHFEAVAGRREGALWARLAYDWSRLESDRFEPPLLDARWIYPDRPPGEYESEGYAGPLGSLVEEFGSDGSVREATRPGNLDRPHCLSLALIGRLPASARGAHWTAVLAGGWTLGIIGRLESGRPFTQAYVYPSVIPPGTAAPERGPDDPAWETVPTGEDPNGERLPITFDLDLALQRRFALGSRFATLTIEALNVIDRENVIAIYRATGQPDEDGCLGRPGCPGSTEESGEIDPGDYHERLIDPRHYGHPFMLRGSVSVELF
ncbi:MAG: TonB-dependent receptor [Candidatus Eisenbacteria sp.]|nr:TonB-dependent receptor [Candidatus Eisenbacteria bacterium]